MAVFRGCFGVISVVGDCNALRVCCRYLRVWLSLHVTSAVCQLQGIDCRHTSQSISLPSIAQRWPICVIVDFTSFFKNIQLKMMYNNVQIVF